MVAFDLGTCRVYSGEKRCLLLSGGFKPSGDMTFWNQKSVTRGNWVPIPDPENQTGGVKDPIRPWRAKWAILSTQILRHSGSATPPINVRCSQRTYYLHLFGLGESKLRARVYAADMEEPNWM